MVREHDLLTTAEAAQVLGVTAGRIRQLIVSGALPAIKRGRDRFIRRADLDPLRGRKTAPGPAKGQPRGRRRSATAPGEEPHRAE
jgi:excisionase family DNA binding protein